MLISKIISGGQTGVDRGALETALDCGFPYGGLVPNGRLAEDGVVPPKFTALVESTRKDYLYRTEQNVIGSDATLILSRTRELSGGTKRTVEFCVSFLFFCLYAKIIFTTMQQGFKGK